MLSLAVSHLLTRHPSACVYRLDGACQTDDYLELRYCHIRCLEDSEKMVRHRLLALLQSWLQVPEPYSPTRLLCDSQNALRQLQILHQAPEHEIRETGHHPGETPLYCWMAASQLCLLMLQIQL